MHPLKRSAPQEHYNSPTKRPKRAVYTMSLDSTPTQTPKPVHTVPLPPVPPEGGLFARFLTGVQDFANDFWTAFRNPSEADPVFNFDRPAPPPPAVVSKPNGARHPSPPRSLSTQYTYASSVPSTSASQLDIAGSLALHDQHLRLTRRVSGASPGIQKPRVQRHQHIFAAQHKRDVRKSIEEEIFALKRQHGYRQDFQTFKGWTWYQALLLQQEAQGAKHVSPEILKTGPAPQFLEMALRKARETLKAPRPPLPFHPSYDELLLKDRRRDGEIDDRIRPKKRPLPSKLPPAAEKEVDELFAKRGQIAKCARENVGDKDISRLRPGQWLNDEIINFYGAMLLERAQKAGADKENNSKANGASRVNGTKAKGPMKIHYFSTFFWSKLNEGYEKSRLGKWTKKIDIFSKDVILIPINHNNSHWTAAAINFRRKRIESYDSMGMKRDNVLQLLRQYLEKEHQDKRKKPFDFTGWVDYAPEDTPQQENCYDCGVFTCQFLETLSRGEEEFAFKQKDMPYLRRKMVWEIGRATLDDGTS